MPFLHVCQRWQSRLDGRALVPQASPSGIRTWYITVWGHEYVFSMHEEGKRPSLHVCQRWLSGVNVGAPVARVSPSGSRTWCRSGRRPPRGKSDPRSIPEPRPASRGWVRVRAPWEQWEGTTIPRPDRGTPQLPVRQLEQGGTRRRI